MSDRYVFYAVDFDLLDAVCRSRDEMPDAGTLQVQLNASRDTKRPRFDFEEVGGDEADRQECSVGRMGFLRTANRLHDATC